MRSDTLIREVRPGDCQRLAAAMRADDALEVRASDGKEPLFALFDAVGASSGAWTLELGGEVAGMFGVVEPDADTLLRAERSSAVVWLLTSEVVEQHKLAFWSASKRVIQSLLERYESLTAAIDARYTRALRWAWRLGGEVGDPVLTGPSGMPFHPVIWRRHG